MSETREAFRSVGRIRTIIRQTSIAWVQDFRPLRRDVLVRLQNPWQANPGDLLEYELTRSAGKESRWHGEDVIFNHQLDLKQLLGMADKGLSESGLHELLRLMRAQPDQAKGLFSPGLPPALLKQLLEWDGFPVPRKAVLACLKQEGLRAAVARRVLGMEKPDPEWLALLFASSLPGELDQLLVPHLLADEALLRTPPDLGPERDQRVRAWINANDDLRLLLLLDPAKWTDKDVDRWLSAGDLTDPESGVLSSLWADWFAGLDAASRQFFLRRLWKRARVTEAGVPAVFTADEAWQSMLKELCADPEFGEAARRELMGSGDLDPALALRFLLESADAEDEPRFLTALADSDLQLGDLEPAQATGLYHKAACLEEAQRLSLRSRLAAQPGLAAQLEGWLAGAVTQAAALDGLSALESFSRGFVQRLIGMPMSALQRKALVAGISARSPERWADRYLASEAEKQVWREAGAPL